MLKVSFKKRRIPKGISIILCMAMVFTLIFTNIAFAVDTELKAPIKNAQGQYEISKPAQLMYLSKNIGSKDMPRDGHYVLTADIDMAGITGYAAMCKNKENSFQGVFDGQNHVIRNLTISAGGKKYVGLFAYIGDEYNAGIVKNLGMVNVDITGTQNVAGIAGVSYGIVENCFVSGKIFEDGGSNANTAGGILGKNKDGEGDIVGLVKNCYVVADIEGSFNIGGIQGQADGGGIVENCYTAGTLKARDGNGSAGGIMGGFNAAQKVANSAVLISKITGPKDIDKIAGQLNDESEKQVTNCIAWDAMTIAGNEPVIQPIKWTGKSSEELASKATYVALGWDFENIWAWKGTEDNGYPILKSFSEKDQEYKFDWSVGTSIVSTPVQEAKANVDIEVSARVISSSDIGNVEIYYGNTENGSEFTNKAAMNKDSGDVYKGKIPAVSKGNIYYFIKAVTKDGIATKPYNIKNSIKTFIDDGTIYGEPKEIVISLGEEQSTISFNWATIPQIKDTVLQYAKKEGFNGKYEEVKGTSNIVAVTAGFNEKMGHKVTVKGLSPDTTYIYKVGDGKDFMSRQYEFKTAPAVEDTKEFTFLFTTDPQSISMKDYQSLKLVYDYAVSQVPNPAFTIMAGDIVENGYKTSEWANFFESIQDKLATIPLMPAVGTHDFKGDLKYTTFKGKFNLPQNGPDEELKGTAYYWEYGDAFFATLNSEGIPASLVEKSLSKQLDWLEEKVSKTDKKWKIVQFHSGPYTSNHDDTYVRNIVADRFDKMKIDLVLTGHDHMYIRSSMKGDQKVGLGEGTTYITGGTVGNKYYEYLDRAARWTEVYSDKKDLQTVSFVTVSKDKITFKAMQRVDAKGKEFQQIDYFELTNTVAEGKIASKTKSSEDTYVVQLGDCLWLIAQKYGLTWEDLQVVNKLPDPNMIFPGQKIVIPSKK